MVSLDRTSHRHRCSGHLGCGRDLRTWCITGKSALASCTADGATVSTALAAFNAQNPTLLTNVTGGGTTTPTAPTTYGLAADYTFIRQA